MFIELNDGSVLNVSKIATITIDGLSIKYRLINGSVKDEIFSDESSLNEKLDFIKSKLVMK